MQLHVASSLWLLKKLSYGKRRSSKKGIDNAENKEERREPLPNQTTNVSHNQQTGKTLQAGLGRDRMTENDYAGRGSDD